MHGPWGVEDPQQRMMDQTQFLTDLALAGAALILASTAEGLLCR